MTTSDIIILFGIAFLLSSCNVVKATSIAKMVVQFLFRISGSVIVSIYRQVFLLIIYTTALCSLSKIWPELFEISFPQTLIPILGLVTGLLLVFRTNTAYDRFYEGRRLWGNLTANVRSLARTIWIFTDERDPVTNGIVERTVDKIGVLNLLVAFCFTTRNYLQEKATTAEELENLLSVSFGSLRHTCFRRKSLRNLKEWSIPDANDFIEFSDGQIPLEIAFHISAYISTITSCGSPICTSLNNALSSLVDHFTSFERIKSSPIPPAYVVHLNQTLWVYLLALPFQLIGTNEWLTIPAVAVASFALLGIQAIGEEIEDPFGSSSEIGSENDLPLTIYCNNIKEEIHKVIQESWNVPSKHASTRRSFLKNSSASSNSIADIRVPYYSEKLIMFSGSYSYLPDQDRITIDNAQ